MTKDRDLIGYGREVTTIGWPDRAKLAISLVVNYEEGSERSQAMGDADQEPVTEWGTYPFPETIRNLAMETQYEFGSRVGVWRILDVLAESGVKATFYACALAFEQHPAVAKAAAEGGHGIVSHGWRWEEVFRLSEAEEREHIRLAVESLERTTGRRPIGWYCRYGPSERTRRLLLEEGGFLYDCDAYNDDTPYFVEVAGRRHLVIPYTPDCNDFNFWHSPGFVTGEHFYAYLKDAFDELYREGQAGATRMMSVGLHTRIVGRAGRIGALRRFVEYAQGHEGVWFATRDEIARWWLEQAG
jgi:peptidoglycan/xylan/chitin deacetylase (PgdA/CDA1 family)